MTHPPAVAAITVNFGNPSDTLECVASLRGTQYPALHIIVVDNASPEQDRTALQQGLPPGVDLVLSDHNRGFSGGNNLGIRRALDAGAHFVLLINNDATLAPDALDALVRAAQAIPNAGIIGGKIFWGSGPGPDLRIWSGGGRWSRLRACGYHVGMGERDQGQYDAPADTDLLSGCMWFVPAGVFRKVGLLPEEFFLYGEDVDYCLSVRRAGFRVRYEPSAIAYHKVSRSHWHNRGRAAPMLNYYTNRNRFIIARRWLTPAQRVVFYLYMLGSRTIRAVVRRDRSFLSGLWDGIRGATGPQPAVRS